MSIADSVLARVRDLPLDMQLKVLEYAEALHREIGLRRPRRSLQGLLADQGVDITEEDIAEARREMWGNFPRDIEP